jgi:hypothetical protein
MRKIKNVSKSFREYNIRRRGLNQPEVTLEEYLALGKKIPINHLGRINPQILAGEKHMQAVFGDTIFTERKICIKCNHTKPVVDFLCRYRTKRIENICKMCERTRKRKEKK